MSFLNMAHMPSLVALFLATARVASAAVNARRVRILEKRDEQECGFIGIPDIYRLVIHVGFSVSFSLAVYIVPTKIYLRTA
jgi:hypothetical protein